MSNSYETTYYIVESEFCGKWNNNLRADAFFSKPYFIKFESGQVILNCSRLAADFGTFSNLPHIWFTVKNSFVFIIPSLLDLS